MKLVLVGLAMFLLSIGTASAQVLNPPGGPVYEEDIGPVLPQDRAGEDYDVEPAPGGDESRDHMNRGDRRGDRMDRDRDRFRGRGRLDGRMDRGGFGGRMDRGGGRMNGQQGRMGKRGRLRQALIERFDLNHDGRLGPRERQAAIKALRERRDEMQQRGAGERRMRRFDRFIERFDTNRDGNVGPGEMPPNAQRRLRKFDRDRDGWVKRDERVRP